MRNKATNYGYLITAAAFISNEACRLTLRTPLFKLKAHNVAFWLLVPTMITRSSWKADINDRIDRMWTIHENRVKRGLGGTFQSSGLYDGLTQHYQDKSFRLFNGLNVRRDEIVNGKKQQVRLDNPFMRWHQSFDTNSTHMDDFDDLVLKETDNFERAKMHQAKESDTVGMNSVIPFEEDELAWDDPMGENPLNHAPDGNMPVIDHRIEEDQVWAFRTNFFNQ